jgi:fatty-acyl-CoA synthase
MNIAQILRASVDRHPNQLALVFGYRRWTYSQWLDRIECMAHALRTLGVRPGDRVAMFLWASEFSVTSYFACQLLGAISVPLNHRLSSKEAAFILDDSGARVLIYGKAMTDAARKIENTVRSVHDFVCCANDADLVPHGHHHFETLIEERHDTGFLNHYAKSDDISALVYTSGTTGRPKGVIHTHANDVAIAMNCVMEYGLTAQDIALHIAPLYHVGGMQAYFIPHLMVGGANVVTGKYSTAKTLRAIEAEKITTLFAVPTQIQDILHDPDLEQYNISTLRLITTGGAAISSAAMEQVIDRLCPNIFNGYGMTEASLSLLLHPEDAIARLGSCGKPTLITEARIIRTHDTNDISPSDTVSRGEIGQLIVRGPQTMEGYWNRPFETSKKLKAGWVYTGDLFSQDADGYYFFQGRADDMIISGGENIYPREVEDVLSHCPGVREVAVIGVPDPKWGQVVTACIQPVDETVTAQSITDFCTDHDGLASFKKPRRVHFLDRFPMNPSGKVLRNTLLEMVAAQTAQKATT